MTKQVKVIIFSCLYMAGIIAFFCEQFLFIVLPVIAVFIMYACKRRTILSFAVIICLAFILGLLNSKLHIKQYDDISSYSDNEVTAVLKVITIPSNNSDEKTKFFAGVKSIKTAGAKIENINAKTIVTIKDREDKFNKIKLGDTLEVNGILKSPPCGVNPSQFDYARYLRYKNTFTLLYVGEEWKILSGADDYAGRLLSGLNDIRTKILKLHSKNINSPMLEVLGGIIFGDDAVNPDDDTKKAFVNSGIIHILAASGMNVTLIFGIWFFVAKSLRLNYRFSVITGILLILFYTCMTGFGPPIIRASIMLILILVGKLIDRKTSTMSLLFFVALIMLLYNPLMLFDIGFQLSFIVTFALILTAPLIAFNFKFKPVNYILGCCIIPVIAQMFAAPLQLYYFNTFALYSVFANIAIIPVLSLVSFAGFISSMLAVINSIADKVCIAADFLLNPFLVYIVNVADFFANLPYAIMYLKKPSIFQIILYFIILLIIIFSLKYKIKNRFIAISLSFLIFILLASFIPLKNNKTEIIFFAVGNADAILIKSPEEKYFLIDSGKYPYASRYSQAKNIILKYLTDKGVKEIDSFVITHFDSDHSGGSIDLMKNLKINKIYISDNSEDTNLSSKIISYIDNNKLNKQIVSNRQEIYKEKGFKILLIKPKGENILTENQQSIITMLVTENMNVLFMGDGDKNSYKALPEEFKNNIKIIKIGHHGALNSLDYEMISDINVAVISTGANVYNHPHPETVNLLKSYNKQILRTDYHNAVKIVIDKDKCMYYLYSPRYKRFIFGDYIVRP